MNTMREQDKMTQTPVLRKGQRVVIAGKPTIHIVGESITYKGELMNTKKITLRQLQKRLAPGSTTREFCRIMSDKIGNVSPRTIEGWVFGKTPHAIVREWVEAQYQQRILWGVK